MEREKIIHQDDLHSSQLQEDENAPTVIQNFILKHIDNNNIQLISCGSDYNEATEPCQSIANFRIVRPTVEDEVEEVEYSNELELLENTDSHNQSAEVGVIRISEQHSAGSHLIPPIHEQKICRNEEKVPAGLTAYSCFKCNEQFTSLPLFRKHLKTHRLVKHFNCTKCSEGFNIEDNLEIHMVTQHPEGRNIDVCPICKIQFHRKASLKSHVIMHQVEELVLCDECEAEFQHEDELFKHMESHVLLKIKPQSPLTPLTCKYCTMDFKTLSHYKQHVAKHIDVERNVLKRKQKRRKPNAKLKKKKYGLFGCRFCRKLFPKQSLLSRHERIHTGEKPYKCQYCEKGFSQSNTLTSHLCQHTGLKPFSCTLCPARFSQKGNLRAHVYKTHTVRKCDYVYKCQECTCIFSTLSSLNGHITRAHTNKVEEEEETGESMIDKVMNSLKQLNNECNPELKPNTKQNPTIIPSPPVPGSTIVKLAGNHVSGNVQLYTVRQKMIDNVRWYFCNYCSHSFKKPSDLFKHFNVHTLEKSFTCSKCNQAFALKTTLARHETVHQKFGCNWKYCNNTNKSLLRNGIQHSAYYVCILCHAAFLTLQEMKMHQVCHQSKQKNINNFIDESFLRETDGDLLLKPEPETQTRVSKILERPFYCEICNTNFTRVSSLKRHMLYHAGEKFKCTLCPKSFVAKHRLNEHLNSHKNIRKFVCKVCGNKFGTGYLLKQHAKIHDRFKEFMCPYCDRQFKNEKVCRFHLRTIHQVVHIEVEQLKTPKRIYNNSNEEPSDETKFNPNTMTDISETEKLSLETTDHKNPDDFPVEQSATLLLNVETPETQEPYEIFYLNIGNNGEILQENLMSNGSILLESLNSLQEPTFILNAPAPIRAPSNEIQQTDMADSELRQVEALTNGQQEISVEQFSAVDLGMGTLPINLIQTAESSVLEPNLINDRQIPNDAHVICINCHKLFPGYDEFEKHVCRQEAALVIDEQIENNDETEKVEDVVTNDFINNDTIMVLPKDSSEEDEPLIVIPAKSATKELSLDQVRRSPKKKLGPQVHPLKQLNNYNCPCCAYSTRIEDKFQKHLTSHPDWADRDDRLCKFCLKIFQKPSDLKRHLRTHTGERPFECGDCHKKFTLKSTLQYHLKTHLTGFKGVTCVVCNAMFLSKSSLKVHMLLHTGERPYGCKYCQQTFRTSAIRHTHEKNVHVRKMYLPSNSSKPKLGGAKLVKLVADEVAENVRKETEIAPRELAQQIQPQGTFILNNATQSNAVALDPVFLIEQIQNSSLAIDNRGSVPIDLDNFGIVNVGEMQLENNNSGQVKVKAEPSVYLDRDTTEKSSKIECDICHKMYASKDVLRKHKRKIHKQNRKFPCIKCDKGYDTLEELNSHIAKLHSGLRPYTCQYCSNSFSEESSLKTHMKRIHKNVLEQLKTEKPILDLFSTASDFI